jgi:hypothetical protein
VHQFNVFSVNTPLQVGARAWHQAHGPARALTGGRIVAGWADPKEAVAVAFEQAAAHGYHPGVTKSTSLPTAQTRWTHRHTNTPSRPHCHT